MKRHLPADHRKLVEALRRRVLEGPGETDPAIRQAAALSATGGSSAHTPVAELAHQIGEAASRTTDAQVAAVVRATGTEKAAFEVVLAAAVGAGLLRWRQGVSALDKAIDAPA